MSPRAGRNVDVDLPLVAVQRGWTPSDTLAMSEPVVDQPSDRDDVGGLGFGRRIMESVSDLRAQTGEGVRDRCRDAAAACPGCLDRSTYLAVLARGRIRADMQAHFPDTKLLLPMPLIARWVDSTWDIA